MIGSPEKVKIQRSLVQNLSKIKRIKIIGRFLAFLGIKIPPKGSQQLLGSKFHKKWTQHHHTTQSAVFKHNPTFF